MGHSPSGRPGGIGFWASLLAFLGASACRPVREESPGSLTAVSVGALEASPNPAEARALRRAISFLGREVPQWPRKNRCFSCHNNGDGARALYLARQLSLPVDPSSLEETTAWLLAPEGWKAAGPPGQASDGRLSTLQFAHALVAGLDSGLGGPAREALSRAAQILTEHQEPDGSWSTEASGLAGSPVTYGRMLATAVSRKILARAQEERLRPALGRADAWLLSQEPGDVLGAGAQLLGLGSMGPGAPERNISQDLELLGRGQTREGGWGPYRTSPPEAFDTAVALLGLFPFRGRPGVSEMIRRGRAFLFRLQNSDGGWPETTRPPGAASYAQRMSTTSWATIALLATQ